MRQSRSIRTHEPVAIGYGRVISFNVFGDMSESIFKYEEAEAYLQKLRVDPEIKHLTYVNEAGYIVEEYSTR